MPGPLAEWRARRIEDPVERLRYLRQARRQMPRLRMTRWRYVAVIFTGLALLIPAFTPSRARGPGQPAPKTKPGAELGRVWQVTGVRDYELYSNGLRIDPEFQVDGRPRQAFAVFDNRVSGAVEPALWKTSPAGIVFHSTESLQVPFEPNEARSIQNIGRYLLSFVRSEHAYHFVIDRFGQVHRVVSEATIANHAGYSMWADTQYTYVNLNAAFLSVAFEGQAGLAITPAQITGARLLTEMLRAKYAIAPLNCVTHAQVSLNPSNWKLGYHTDWAANFPFAALGLPDNYAQPPASISRFGFDYDEVFERAMGEPWQGATMARELAEHDARAAGADPDAWRTQLHERYQKLMLNARSRAPEEIQDEEKRHH